MPETVARIAPEHRRLVAPTELRQLPAWICWMLEQHEGEDKPRKVPRYANGGIRFGKQGGASDRSKLVTFAAARDAAARLGMAGVGIAMLADWGFTALDFDHCVGPNGELPPEIAEIVSRTYAEYSPSGQGIRAFVRGNFGNHKAKTTSLDYGFETFASTGFVTLTGNVHPLCDVMGMQDTIAQLDKQVGDLCEKRFGARDGANPFDPDDFMAGLEKPLGLQVGEIEDLLGQLDADMGRDDWIRVGMALHHECDGDDTGFEMFNDWSELGAKYPGREALETQWASFERRKGERSRQVTMKSVIKMARDANSEIDLSVLQKATEEEAARADRTTVSTPADYEGKFPIETPLALASLPPMDWWIKGVLPMADLGVLYGASGSGKSFVTLDLAIKLARGIDWQGRKTKRARVLYIAAEGGAGVGKRIDAFCRYHEMALGDIDVGVLRVPPNIMDADDIEALVRAIAAAGGFDIIFIDTYAQVTPGANENASEDMGRALSNCSALRKATGAMVILVHHSGKDASKGARGWSGIRAAVDVEMEIAKDENGERTLTLTKLKDGEDGLRWGVKLEVVKLDMDFDGDVVTSCVAVIGDPPAPVATEEKERKGIRRYGRTERHVLEVIELEYRDEPSARFHTLVDKCVEMLPKPDSGRDNRRAHVNRAIQSLAKGVEPPLSIEHGHVIFLT